MKHEGIGYPSFNEILTFYVCKQVGTELNLISVANFMDFVQYYFLSACNVKPARDTDVLNSLFSLKKKNVLGKLFQDIIKRLVMLKQTSLLYY